MSQRDYFYYKEHLLIVTELLRDSLFQFYKYIDASNERGVTSYFTPATIAAIAVQLLNGLAFVHDCGLIHCDISTHARTTACVSHERRTRQCSVCRVGEGSVKWFMCG